ncbi:MAG: response regulator [Methylibium sp.]|uniref:hybrid sensor histidine kinase/response regulator n=1 Tax=Methylibium sp. TaxID=2067992 RepID=UPI0018554DD1|nr:hybrid sensor histidine kinase/response regulator [Methylibium sp.]MBA3598738.1 response regulator [Methylibium sp.]
MNSGARDGAGEDALRARGEALRLREEHVLRRETTADSDEALVLTQADRLAERALQIREANERLVIASLHSQELTEVAEQANERKDDFLAMLSHELRNPLAPIRNAVAILGLVSHAEPRLPWIHAVIDRQVAQLTRLLDDLLDVARVRSGKLVLQRRPVAAREFIEQAAESCRPLAEARRQQFTVALPAEPVYVDGDPTRLTQVFANLFSNAVKYTHEGGTVAVSAQAVEQTLVVRVQDNGRGIAPEAQARIFELFTQEDHSLAHAQGGLGIGLSLVRRLVELHGGTVAVASDGEDRGSEFVVALPLLQGQLPAVPAELQSRPAARRGMRIAVIEDNVDANDSLNVLLTLVGHEVFSAYDGTSGASLVLESRPQMVLCDIGLPGMDGLAVATYLREEMREALPLMVALTGYGQTDDRARALAAGFALHLTKPVDTQALLALIDGLADRLAGVSH